MDGSWKTIHHNELKIGMIGTVHDIDMTLFLEEADWGDKREHTNRAYNTQDWASTLHGHQNSRTMKIVAISYGEMMR